MINLNQTFGKKLNPLFAEKLTTIFPNKMTAADADTLQLDRYKTARVVNNVPRFVESDAYVESFSFQWTTFTNTQVDSQQDSDLTLRDLMNKTGLTPEDVKGKLILDAGVGVGRHTEILASWGAFVVGVDLSDAVDTARANLQNYDNAVIIQADLADLPFVKESFDVVISIGVLHHTDNTQNHLKKLASIVKPGGTLAVWVYPPKFNRRANWTPIASHLPAKAFHDWTTWMVRNARKHTSNVLVSTFKRQFPFSTKHQTDERTILAVFDGYTPTYHWTHTEEEVKKWFCDEHFIDIKTHAIQTAVSGTKSKTQYGNS